MFANIAKGLFGTTVLVALAGACNPCPAPRAVATNCTLDRVKGADTLIAIKCTTTFAVRNGTVSSTGSDTATDPNPK